MKIYAPILLFIISIFVSLLIVKEYFYDMPQCATYTDCKSCAKNGGCAWCLNKSKCVPTDRMGYPVGRDCNDKDLVTFDNNCDRVNSSDMRTVSISTDNTGSTGNGNANWNDRFFSYTGTRPSSDSTSCPDNELDLNLDSWKENTNNYWDKDGSGNILSDNQDTSNVWGDSIPDNMLYDKNGHDLSCLYNQNGVSKITGKPCKDLDTSFQNRLDSYDINDVPSTNSDNYTPTTNSDNSLSGIDPSGNPIYWGNTAESIIRNLKSYYNKLFGGEPTWLFDPSGNQILGVTESYDKLIMNQNDTKSYISYIFSIMNSRFPSYDSNNNPIKIGLRGFEDNSGNLVPINQLIYDGSGNSYNRMTNQSYDSSGNEIYPNNSLNLPLYNSSKNTYGNLEITNNKSSLINTSGNVLAKYNASDPKSTFMSKFTFNKFPSDIDTSSDWAKVIYKNLDYPVYSYIIKEAFNNYTPLNFIQQIMSEQLQRNGLPNKETFTGSIEETIRNAIRSK